MPETVLTKRIRSYADGGAAYSESCKRMYINNSDVLVEPMPPPPKLAESAKNLLIPTSISLDILRDEGSTPKTDMEYVQQYKGSEEKMDWKSCFEARKQEGFLVLTAVVQV